MRKGWLPVEQVVTAIGQRGMGMAVQWTQRFVATRPGEVGSMDIVADQFGNGVKFRILDLLGRSKRLAR